MMWLVNRMAAWRDRRLARAAMARGREMRVTVEVDTSEAERVLQALQARLILIRAEVEATARALHDLERVAERVRVRTYGGGAS